MPIPPLSPTPTRVRRRRAVLAATFFALLGILVLAPAPTFALEPASRLDRDPLALTAQPADGAGATTSSTTSSTTPGPVAPDAAARSLQAAQPGRQVAQAESVAPFRLIAVKLHTDSTDPVLVRVHHVDGWGEWQSLATDSDDAPDTGTSEAIRGDAMAGGDTFSEPAWIGTADGYEVSLPADATDATAEVVRDTTKIVKHNGDQAGAAVVPAVGQPPINSRASWSARTPVEAPDIAPTVQMAIVHHSVTGNDYSPADVPGILRSIQTFHIDGRGWNDIAYNFAVDQFGGTWEARAGGITNAVIGGHAMGANSRTTGVVTLGDFTAAAPPAAMVSSVANLIGWKLYIHGTDPSGSNVFTLAENTKYPTGTVLTLPNIIGHRDVGATGCPGDQLYPQLGQIRSQAATKWQQLRGSPGFWPGVAVGANADGRLQAFAVGNDQQVYTRWQLTGGGWSGWAAMGGRISGRLTVGANADGRLELFGIGVDGTLQTTWQLSPNATWSAMTSMGGQWSPTAGVGVGRNPDGRLEAFTLSVTTDEIGDTWQRTPNGRWDGPASIGGSFPSSANIAVGTNQDGRLEVFAVGDGPTLVHSWQVPTGGWAPFTSIGAPITGELGVANDADGRVEVVGIGADGRLWDAWQLTPNGSWSGPAVLKTGLAPNGDATLARDADGRLEFFGLSPTGSLLNIWQGSPNGRWVGPASMGGSWIGLPAVLASATGRLTALAFAAPGSTTLAVNAQSSAGGVFSGWSSLP